MSVLVYIFAGTVVLAIWYLMAVIACLIFDIDDFFIGLLIAVVFFMLPGALGKLALTIF